MVDYLPFSGDFSGTIVRNNTILGGFSTDTAEANETDGANTNDIVIK